MNPAELLQRVVGILDRLEVPAMLTGSLATAYYGHIRATQDIDLVVEIGGDRIAALVRGLEAAGLYVSEAAAREAIRYQGLFNAVDARTGWKVDFIIRKDRPFSRQEFDRRRAAEVAGLRLDVTTVEDLIVAKLEWSVKGESALQLRDIREMLRSGSVDRAHVERWVRDLNLEPQWQAVLKDLHATD